MKRVRQVIGMASAAALALASTALVGPAYASAATPVTLACGAVVTQNTTLAADVGPCRRDGIIIGADNITLNLGGHTVFGTNAKTDNVGIHLIRHSGVTVRAGTVRDFGTGVALQAGSNYNIVSAMNLHDNIGRLDTSGTFGDGVGIFASSNNLITGNEIVHNGPYEGIGVFGNGASGKANPAFGNRLVANHVADNTILQTSPEDNLTVSFDMGVNLGFGLGGSSHTTVSNNVIEGNGFDGINACSIRGIPCMTDHNVITGNVVRDNGFTNLSTLDNAELGRGIFVGDISLDGFDFSPPTHDLISNNVVTHNASTGLFLTTTRNRVLDNYIVGNGVIHNSDIDDVDFEFFNTNVPFNCDVNPPQLAGNVIQGNTFGTVTVDSLSNGTFLFHDTRCLVGNTILNPPPPPAVAQAQAAVAQPAPAHRAALATRPSPRG